MNTLCFPLAGLFGFLSVAFGAFGAHALKDRLEPAMLQVFQTGVLYQMFHALALLAVGLLFRFQDSGMIVGNARMFTVSAVCFTAGIVLFSGSLYTLALTGIRAFGAITPIGGVLFLVGWAALAWTTGMAGRTS